MKTKKILIIARDFIPYHPSLGAVIRVIKLSEFLLARGFEVHLIAAKGVQLDYFGYRSLSEKINITYVDDFLQARNNRKKKTAQNKNQRLSDNQSSPKVFQRFLTIIDRSFVPDMGVILANKYAAKAVNVIRQHHIRNVLVSSPPHSTQIIGYLVKRHLKDKINLITEYRDSWNTLGIYAKTNPLLNRISRLLEKKVLKSADHFIYHSPPVLDKIRKTLLDISPKSTLIMNGYDPGMRIRKKSTGRRNACLKIGYFGAITDAATGFRNPERFFQVVNTVTFPVKIVFYGHIDISEYWQRRLGDKLEIHGHISHAEALEKMMAMDILMLLHSQKEGADEVIPAKIFEYMLVGKPILAIGPVPMESAEMVKSEKLGYTMNLYHDEDMKNTLIQIYEDWENHRMPAYNEATCRQYSRYHQFEKLLPILQ